MRIEVNVITGEIKYIEEDLIITPEIDTSIQEITPVDQPLDTTGA